MLYVLMPTDDITAVAVSGGMDSLLALALMAESGQAAMAVHGVFFPETQQKIASLDAIAAQCDKLSIPLRCVDLSEAFRKLVITPFLEEYRVGRTPNPCAICNPAIKFGLLLDAAQSMGATALASGHYAGQSMEVGLGTLRKGVDATKDQSYFLALIPEARLRKARFPLGSWRKADVPAALAARGLAPPEAKESQEICFVPNDDYRAFLRQNAADLGGPGPILLDGRRVGTHQGLWAYTIGQRRGLGVAHHEPLYVTGKDLPRNALLVGPKERTTSRHCTASGCNLLVPPAEWPETVLARTRYRQREQAAHWAFEHGRVSLTFMEPQGLPAPGQLAVLYDETGRVLAGGVLDA